MVDGDKVHPGLSYRHQKVYKQLCEGYVGEAEISDKLLCIFAKKDIPRCGDEPIQFITKAVKIFEQLPDIIIDRGEVRMKLDILACAIDGKVNRRALEFALTVSKQQLENVSLRKRSIDLQHELLKKYFYKIYSADFVDKITHSSPNTQHFRDTSQEFVTQRLEAMRPFMEEGFNKFATQVIKNGTCANLRMPRQTREVSTYSDISNTDVFALWEA